MQEPIQALQITVVHPGRHRHGIVPSPSVE